jgi:hypothetical protein
MNARLSSTPEQSPRALLAKLVIGLSALVALATSAPPEWHRVEYGQLQLAFDGRNERTAILSIELAGELYADAREGTLDVSATADRTASDLVLSVRALEPSMGEPAEAEGDSDVDTELDAGAGIPTARPDVKSPNVASLSVPVACAEHDPSAPRAERCVAQFEITLARRSQRPLAVELNVAVQLDGRRETEPPGTFQLTLEERAP